jgi:SAM-dependent methyltransferase
MCHPVRVTGTAHRPSPAGTAPTHQGLTDLDTVLTTLAVRNLVESVVPCLAPGSAVLVAGTGLPIVADVLASRGMQVLVVDPSTAVLETIAPLEGVLTRKGTLDQQPADDHSVDAVVIVDAVAELDRPGAEAAVAEIERVLTPGGVAVLSARSTEPIADLLPHQLAARWSSVTTMRQLDVGGFALHPGVGGESSAGAGVGQVVAGRPMVGCARWLHLAANREVPAAHPLVHLAPGVPTGLTMGMHELLNEQQVASRQVAELQSTLHQLGHVQQRLVEAEQAAGRARELEAALIDSRARVDELHGMIDTILRSTSWRVTEPVRRASGVARGMANKMALDTLRDTVRKYRQS